MGIPASKLLILCLLGTLLHAGGTAVAQAPQISWELDDALRQIDRQVQDFRSALARAEVVRYDAGGVEQERFTGNAFVNSAGSIRLSLDDDRRIILLQSGNVQVYDAARAQVEQFRLSDHRDRLEPWLRLGFSTAGRDLKDRFLVTLLGEDEIGSNRTIAFELTPKRERDREAIRHVRLWIDQASWMPVRQQVSRTETGEQLEVNYSMMARNLRLNPALFEDDWPRGTKKVRR